MKKVESYERDTGMGATRFTAVLLDGRWMRVSSHPDCRYHGRSRGIEEYSVEVADDPPTAHFYRSNSGKEHVQADNGLEWRSFDDAHRWASGEPAPTSCPHCGRAL